MDHNSHVEKFKRIAIAAAQLAVNDNLRAALPSYPELILKVETDAMIIADRRGIVFG